MLFVLRVRYRLSARGGHSSRPRLPAMVCLPSIQETRRLRSNIAEIAGDAACQRRYGIAAAGDRDQLFCLGPLAACFAATMVPRSNGVISKRRAGLPDQRRGVVDRLIDPRDRSRADVEDHAVGGIASRPRHGTANWRRNEPTTASTGRMMAQLAASALSMIRSAVAARSFSASDLPMPTPCACRMYWPCRRRSPAHRPC